MNTAIFNANDRCDRCSAQAYMRADLKELELMFCLHHAKEHNLSLECEGWSISYDIDAIERLYGGSYEPVDA